MVLFAEVTNYGWNAKFVAKGVCFEYDTYEEYKHDLSAFIDETIIPSITDDEQKLIVVDQRYRDAMRLHRDDGGDKSNSFYWNKMTGRKVPEKMVRFLACSRYFFTKEERMPEWLID